MLCDVIMCYSIGSVILSRAALLRAPGVCNQHLKPKYDKLVLDFAFDFDLLRYTSGASTTTAW